MSERESMRFQRAAMALRGLAWSFPLGLGLGLLFNLAPDGVVAAAWGMGFWFAFSLFILLFLTRLTRLSRHPKWIHRCRGARRAGWMLLALPLLMALVAACAALLFGERALPLFKLLDRGPLATVDLIGWGLDLFLKVRISQMCGILGIVGKSAPLRRQAARSILWQKRVGVSGILLLVLHGLMAGEALSALPAGAMMAVGGVLFALFLYALFQFVRTAEMAVGILKEMTR